MTVRLSTGMQAAMCNGGSGGGIKGSLAAGFIYIYAGVQPVSPNTGASGTLVAKVTKDGDGSTGLTFDTTTTATISKAAAETWRMVGLANGQAGWFRFAEAADTPTATSATAKRIDGSVGTSGADMEIANTNIVLAAISTVDNFTITMPGA